MVTEGRDQFSLLSFTGDDLLTRTSPNVTHGKSPRPWPFPSGEMRPSPGSSDTIKGKVRTVLHLQGPGVVVQAFEQVEGEGERFMLLFNHSGQPMASIELMVGGERFICRDLAAIDAVAFKVSPSPATTLSGGTLCFQLPDGVSSSMTVDLQPL